MSRCLVAIPGKRCVQLIINMKPNTLAFLSKGSPAAIALQRLKKNNASIILKNHAKGDYVVLECALESVDGNYVCLLVPVPIQDYPESRLKLVVPHRDVLLLMQSDQKKILGFSGHA
jgi:hypothetical protein